MNKTSFKFDLNNLAGKVYFSVATWHNKDNSSEEKQAELKVVSQDIIMMILDEFLSQLGDDVKSKIVTLQKNAEKSTDV